MANKKQIDKKNKSAFIRRHPDKKPSEVVALGKGMGIAFTAHYVGVVRAAQRKGMGDAVKRIAPALAKAVFMPFFPVGDELKAMQEQKLQRLAVEIGFGEAQALLETVRRLAIGRQGPRLLAPDRIGLLA